MSNLPVSVIYAEVPVGGLGSYSKHNDVCIPPAAAHMLEHLFFNANEKIFEMFIRNGILISAKTEMFRTRFTMCTMGSPARAKKVFLERLSGFSINEDALLREKEIVLMEEMSEKKKINPFVLKRKELLCRHYGGDRNTTVIGTREEIEQLSHDALQTIRQIFYDPEKILFCCYDNPQNTANNPSMDNDVVLVSNSCFSYEVCHLGGDTVLLSFLYSLYTKNHSERIENYLFLLYMEQHIIATMQRNINGARLSQSIDCVGEEMLFSVIMGLNNCDIINIANMISDVNQINETYYEDLKEKAIKCFRERLYVMNSGAEKYYILARVGLNDTQLIQYLKEYSCNSFLARFMNVTQGLKKIKNCAGEEN